MLSPLALHSVQRDVIIVRLLGWVWRIKLWEYPID